MARKALIVGGGIAGTVTALALHKAGIAAEIFEAYPTGADDVGAFLVVFTNGLEALRVIDAHGPVVAHSFPARRVALIGADGAVRGERPISGGDGAALGPRTLRRATLYRVLHDEAVRRGIPVHHGKRLTGADTVPGPHGDRVAAAFADGTTAEGDVLIGADGLHSVTRTLIDPDAPRPRHTGQNTVCGYARADDVPLAPDTYTMIAGSRGFLGCTRAPGGEVWWFANVPGAELPRGGSAPTAAEWRVRLAALFADDATPAAALVRAAGDTFVASGSYDIARTPRWHRGPLVILGDAAHAAAPNAAQGASMAIEDGVVLARALRDHADAPTAYAAFEAARRERVEKVVAASAGLAGRVGTAEGNREREDAQRRRAEGDGGSDWLTGYRIGW
ncbi:FAD-dependent monooxygenase [Streptomyces benahoarensis]|uniref:FAD-dependent monooxygenase n=1 Tax=Streptomyces benahoarensis TaxID=2595054 RepID=A0A553ZLX6_9ACTN|nr:FAD-dependent monooxygenase [Streptomyces benahoarensis]TSB23702.1 FAD-dependent monooxygenase [Streptomyces benahoarensis]TSB42296.1 FAD-dependent monooxygenase [Streptomyces benahoarensis]